MARPADGMDRPTGRGTTPGSTAWTAANWVLFAAFAFSVAVQWNDPDPLPWMALYGIAAATCALEARRRAPWPLAAGVAVIALAWAALVAYRAEALAFGALFDEFEMRATGVEEAREVVGLLIVACWMVAVAAGAARRGGRRRNTG